MPSDGNLPNRIDEDVLDLHVKNSLFEAHKACITIRSKCRQKRLVGLLYYFTLFLTLLALN